MKGELVMNTEQESTQIIPESLKNPIYTPAFLKKHIGDLVKVEFLIGTNSLQDRIGILLEVGASFIVLSSVQDNNILYCDIFSIKFVTISRQPFMYTPQNVMPSTFPFLLHQSF